MLRVRLYVRFGTCDEKPSIEFMESNYGPEADSVTVLPPSSITESSAVLNGKINPIGTEALAWFEYSTSSTPSCNSPQNFKANGTPPSTPPLNPGSGQDDVLFSAPISGLSPGTTYYFWACSLGALYQANSNVESFVTAKLADDYVCPVAEPGLRNATLHGQRDGILGLGGDLRVGDGDGMYRESGYRQADRKGYMYDPGSPGR